MQTLSFITNLLGLALSIVALLVKGKNIEKILLLVLLANSLIAAGYLLGGTGINGAASCLLACVQTLVNYFFEKKNKPLPKTLIGLYLLSYVAVNVAVGGFSLGSVIAILACSAFVASISQKNGRSYRLCAMANCILWLIYDVVTASYSSIITHATMLAVSIAGFVIHDMKKKS